MLAETQTRRYLYPPRTELAIPWTSHPTYASLGFIAQLKYNDTHSLFDFEDGELIQVWNRHRGLIAYDWSGRLGTSLRWIGQQLTIKYGPGRHLIDGGLLHAKHRAVKDCAAVWDVLILAGKHLVGTTYQERYDMLSALATADRFLVRGFDLGRHMADGVVIPDCLKAERWEEAWGIVNGLNTSLRKDGMTEPFLEGVVLKDPKGRLRIATSERNNGDWMVRSRVQTKRHMF